MSKPTNEIEQQARLEAYFAWERAGRPILSQAEQERMYLEALDAVRRRAGERNVVREESPNRQFATCNPESGPGPMEPMFTALYYPHVSMSADLFKNALFLWDRIEYIAPDEYFRPWYQDAELNEAVGRFAERHVPSDQEKQQVNEAIIDLLKLPLPGWFYVEDLPEDCRYSFYPEKLFPDTWERLRSENLAAPVGRGFETSAPLGLAIMSLLADCCAGSQKRLITDESASYSALDRYLATIGGADFGKFDDKSEHLVTISLKIMNFKDVSLSRLVRLREKEKSKNGAHLTALRHGYLRKVEESANRLSCAKSRQDATEIERVFEQEMRKDLDLLRDELKDEAKKVFFSAEMATAAISLGTAFFQPLIGLVLAGGALYRKKVEYRADRNKTLKGHPMSWLYCMKKLPLF